MGEKKEEGHTGEPPALPGEVWRGDLEDDGAWLCAVAVEHGRVKTFAFGEREGWVEQSRGAGYAILAAWAMTERARAEKAEARLADVERELADFRAVARGRT